MTEIEIPAKFKDAATGQLKVNELLKSYLKLEKLVGKSVVKIPGDDDSQEDRDEFHRMLGVPETPDRYEIAMKSEFLRADPEVNTLLHKAGLTTKQVQLVYDIAAEKIIPALADIANQAKAHQERGKLIQALGSSEKLQQIAPQVETWACKNLPPQVHQQMACTCDGVLAMIKMMESKMPINIGAVSGHPQTDDTEEDLRKLMATPEYWRDHNPKVTERVINGFKRLYPEY
ncbi:MAG: hypothetical protein FWF01_00815 [Alphaproteobacteria bacterium]|nr:hypothetical protein [Alphaproteobacteria bacterium]